MIDVDPKFYLGEDYLIRWRCPSCKERSYIRLYAMEYESCPECAEGLTRDDKKSLKAFRDLIVDDANGSRRKIPFTAA